MSQKLVDASLGIKPEAWAILHLLSSRETHLPNNWSDKYKCYRTSFETAAWYNGREQGCVVWCSLAGKTLIVTFGEVRNSDSLFVDSWEVSNTFLNPPTVRDFTDAAYEARKYFSFDKHYQAADYVVECFRKFVTANLEPEQS